MNKLLKIYKILYNSYGPQGWWPVSSVCSFRPEYRPLMYKVTNPRERFEICMGAILTQNTSWKNVEKSLANLNSNNVSSSRALLKLKIQKISELIRSSGYYNQKTKKITEFALYVIKKYGGSLSKFFSKNSLSLREELLGIKGIGPETCDSILLYAANKPKFVVDAYTKRIFQRLGLINTEDYHKIQAQFERVLPRSLKIYNEYHALIVRHAKEHCAKKPDCSGCQLKANCNYWITNGK